MAKGKKKKYKKWEKIFLFINIFVIMIIIGFYLYRLLYYYNLEHSIVKDDKLITILLKNDLVYSGEGLYEQEGHYYYKGKAVNNYVWYSGRMWRIVSIGDNIKMISEDGQTSLVWGYTNDYATSYVRKWLTQAENEGGIFLKSLTNYENYLVKDTWCHDQITLDNTKCTNYNTEDYVGLLTVEEYLKAGGQSSYLNNGTYWWTSNISDNNKVWYVFDKGGINDNSSSDSAYYSYNVRPVINIKKDVIYYSGKGTEDDPYVINEQSNIIIDYKNIGDYVSFSGYIWRILSKTDNYVKLAMDGYIQVNNEDYLSIYSTNISQYSKNNTVGSYLNKDFYNSLDKENLTECEHYYGSYGQDTNYNYTSVYSRMEKSYVGLMTIGDLFVTDYNNYWLASNLKDSLSLSYIVSDSDGYYADYVSSEKYVRPTICINKTMITSEGNGMKNSPYILGE